MNYISWFAGIGGFDLGLQRAGYGPCIAYSEVDEYACGIFEQHFPGVPNLGDITELNARDIPEAELWCGGFPCQPFSCAGERKGSDDKRHLWPVWFNLIREIRPRHLLLENVPGLLTAEGGRTFNRIISDLAQAGYDAEWTTIGAYEVGAPHKRDRLWVWCVLAHGNSLSGGKYGKNNSPTAQSGGRNNNRERSPGDVRWKPATCQDEALAHPWRVDPAEVVYAPGAGWERPVREGIHRGIRRSTCPGCGADQGSITSVLGRVAHGVPDRVHRIRCLGNSVVPQVVEWIARRVKGEA